MTHNMNAGMFSSRSDDWSTPQELFDKLNEIHHFTLDPASSDDNTKCAYHFTKEQDGLSQNWGGGNQYGLTRRMEDQLVAGLKRLMKKAKNQMLP